MLAVADYSRPAERELEPAWEDFDMKVTSSCTIRQLLGQYPQTRSVFDRYGLKGCGGPEGPAESLGFFARAHGVEANKFFEELQEAIDKPVAAPVPMAASPADTIYRRFFTA